MMFLSLHLSPALSRQARLLTLSYLRVQEELFPSQFSLPPPPPPSSTQALSLPFPSTGSLPLSSTQLPACNSTCDDFSRIFFSLQHIFLQFNLLPSIALSPPKQFLFSLPSLFLKLLFFFSKSGLGIFESVTCSCGRPAFFTCIWLTCVHVQRFVDAFRSDYIHSSENALQIAMYVEV